jgi:hypothetical protein
MTLDGRLCEFGHAARKLPLKILLRLQWSAIRRDERTVTPGQLRTMVDPYNP